MVIDRSASYQVPRIYGTTRADAMWGAGYVTAESRLFVMDVLRHTAQGTLSALLGSSAVAGDSTQLGIQDATPQQLTDQLRSLPQTMSSEGARALKDIEQYVAGINAFIDMTKLDPVLLPAEYPALGIVPQTWTGRLGRRRHLSDRPVHRVRGPTAQQAEALVLAMRRLGHRAGTAVYNDLRLAADPSAVTGQALPLGRLRAAQRPLAGDHRSRLVRRPRRSDRRSRQARGRGERDPGGQPRRSAPGPVGTPPGRRLHLPHMESNAGLARV